MERLLIPSVNGCLWDWHKETDFLLTSGEVEWLPELVMQDAIRFDYNQWKQTWSKSSCSIFCAVGMMSDLWNYKFSLDEIKEIDDKSYTLWRRKGWWWYTRSAVELVCNWWNEKFPNKKTAYYSVLFKDDDKCNKLMNKNYNLAVSFDYTTDYVLDVNDNWNIDRAIQSEYAWVSHCVNEIIEDWQKKIKDNYAWSKHQYYNLNVSNKALYDNDIFHTRAYVYLKVWENNLSELKRLEKVKTACLNALEYNSQLRHATNSQELKDKLHEINEYIRNNNLKYIEEMTQKLRNN